MVETIPGTACQGQRGKPGSPVRALRHGVKGRGPRPSLSPGRWPWAAALTAALLWAAPCIAGTIYKWVDRSGVVHFSDRKPKGPDIPEGGVEEREVKSGGAQAGAESASSLTEARSPIESATRCTFTITGARVMGSGFFISPEGYAVTCKHVLAAGAASATLNDGERTYDFKVISESPSRDLALVLVLTPDPTPYLSLRDAGTLVPGERLYAIGAPAGLQATVTDGVFTGFRKNRENGEKAVQFSAPVNPGNSGGPLVDEQGRVVGVVSWKLAAKGAIPLSGLGFAIPSDYVREEYGAYLP